MRSTVGNYRGDNIVTRGLVLYLDAGSPNSYYGPSNSTVWKDLSGNGNNGTLVNGVEYSNGAMVFDGVDDYALINNPLFNVGTGAFSVEAFGFISSDSNVYAGIFSNSEITGDDGIHLTQRTCWVGTGQLKQGIGNNSTNNFPFNEWFHTVFTRSNDGVTLNLYVNGEKRFDTVVDDSPVEISNNSLGVIGSRYTENYLYLWKGKIPIVRFYTLELTPSEISQNFNAQRSRFGI